jgi:hypothetical protein
LKLINPDQVFNYHDLEENLQNDYDYSIELKPESNSHKNSKIMRNNTKANQTSLNKTYNMN